MEKGRKIGSGRTADIYTWGSGQVVKVFHKEFSSDFIEREQNAGRRVQELGLPVPKIFESTQVNGKTGLVYEHINGPTVVSVLSSHPWKIGVTGKRMGLLHAQVHAKDGAGFPLQKDMLRRYIRNAEGLSEDKKQRILRRLEQLPDGNRLCHSDFHPENILLPKSGPVILDWTTAVCGNPCADVARTAMILRYAALPEEMPPFVRVVIQLVRSRLLSAYLKSYLQATGTDAALIHAWELPVSAARLVENVPAEEKSRLSARIDELLKNLPDS